MNFRFLFAYCFLLAFLFAACHSSPLKKALKKAGSNRKSFESVLEYYSRHPADSLKLKAAKFLIENMPGHYSYSEVYWQEEYYNEIIKANRLPYPFNNIFILKIEGEVLSKKD